MQASSTTLDRPGCRNNRAWKAQGHKANLRELAFSLRIRVLWFKKYLTQDPCTAALLLTLRET